MICTTVMSRIALATTLQGHLFAQLGRLPIGCEKVCASALRIHCSEEDVAKVHTAQMPICPREEGAGNLAQPQSNDPGFMCWTDGDGNSMRVYEPPERTMTNLLTASFTFSLTGLHPFLLFKLKRDDAPFPHHDYQDACC